MASRIRVLGVSGHLRAGYFKPVDIVEVSTQDLLVEHHEVEVQGTSQTYLLADPFGEVRLGPAGSEVRGLQRCAAINEILTAGAPADAYAAFGAAALQHLGILRRERWICVGRPGYIFHTAPGTLSLVEWIQFRGIQLPRHIRHGAPLEAWLTAALLQDHLRCANAALLELLSTATCHPCFPPPPVEDDEAWARVPGCDLTWLTAFDAVSGRVAARARREQDRRSKEEIPDFE